jgi:DNA-binding transcriptional ArsR family regulator
MLWDDERFVGEIAEAMPVTLGAVSQHLAVLRQAGFVDVRAEGRHRYYRANRERLGPLAAALEAMWAEGLQRLAAAIEDDQGRT